MPRTIWRVAWHSTSALPHVHSTVTITCESMQVDATGTTERQDKQVCHVSRALDPQTQRMVWFILFFSDFLLLPPLLPACRPRRCCSRVVLVCCSPRTLSHSHLFTRCFSTMPRVPSICIAVVALAMLFGVSSAFYLPGVAPQKYQANDTVPLHVNKLVSANTQIPFEYYSLNFCKPDTITVERDNLGQFLVGDRIENSLYEVGDGWHIHYSALHPTLTLLSFICLLIHTSGVYMCVRVCVCVV
jgi:hypothetical protein